MEVAQTRAGEPRNVPVEVLCKIDGGQRAGRVENVPGGRLPKSFLTEITEKDRRNTGTFLAEYSNCKKFTAEITIRTQD